MTALRAFVLTALATLFLLLSGPPMFRNLPTLYSGVSLHHTGELVQRLRVDVAPRSPAYHAGLRSGDVVTCLSARDAELLLPPPDIGLHPAYRPGTPISLCAYRSGVWHSVRFVAEPRPAPGYIYGTVVVAALRFLVFAFFLASGIVLVMGRPSPMTWFFFAYCLGNVPSVAATLNWTTLPAGIYAFAAGIPSIVSVLGAPFLLLFALTVPDDRVDSGWRRWASFATWGVTALFAALLIFAFIETRFYIAPSVTNAISTLLTALTILVVLARLASMTRVERPRFAWAAFAIIFGVLANDARNVLPTGPLSIALAVLTVVMPLSLMYAILRRHVIDVRFVISRTVLYASLTTSVVLIIGVVDWATSTYLSQARIAMALAALVTIGLGFVLHRTYGWLERAVDFLLFHRKHEAEAYLNRLAKTLMRANRTETVDRALIHDPYEKLELSMAALFRADGSSFVPSCSAGWEAPAVSALDADHDLVRFLTTERERLDIGDLRSHVAGHFLDHGPAPAIAIPVLQGDDLMAFAVYGIHRSGTKLDPDEIVTLENLCEKAAQAYSRIDNLQHRALTQIRVPV